MAIAGQFLRPLMWTLGVTAVYAAMVVGLAVIDPPQAANDDVTGSIKKAPQVQVK